MERQFDGQVAVITGENTIKVTKGASLQPSQPRTCACLFVLLGELSSTCFQFRVLMFYRQLHADKGILFSLGPYLAWFSVRLMELVLHRRATAVGSSSEKN